MARWQNVSGAELDERVSVGRSLDDLLPSAPAIYMWRRHLRAQRAVVASPTAFQGWVVDTLNVPLATLRKRELSHYAVLEMLSLGGQGLSIDKIETLAELAKNARARSYVAAFLQSLAQSMPSVYVGEAHNLTNRIREHVVGDSGLKDTLASDFKIGWSELDLWFYELPAQPDSEKPKAVRTLLETLATRLTLAPCVRRIG